jgi:hypothetical protein
MRATREHTKKEITYTFNFCEVFMGKEAAHVSCRDLQHIFVLIISLET